MKKAIIPLLLVLLIGCGAEDIVQGTLPPELSTLETIEQVQRWIDDTISYVPDRQIYGYSYIQMPYETIELKTGDCDDVAILFMHILHEYLDKDSYLLIIGPEDKTAEEIKEEKLTMHAAVQHKDIVYDPRGGGYTEYTIVEIFTYTQAMECAKQHHFPAFRGAAGS